MGQVTQAEIARRQASGASGHPLDGWDVEKNTSSRELRQALMGAMAKANPKKQTKKTEAGRDRIRDTNDTVAATCDVLHGFYRILLVLCDFVIICCNQAGCFSTKA